MSETLKSPAIQDAAKGLTGAEKKLYHEAIRQFFGENDAVSANDAGLVRQLIEAKARAKILKGMLAGEMEDEAASRIAVPAVLSLIRQADSTARLIVRLVDRLKAALR
ncbi:hypothetical protein [Mesorhizobium sp. M0187]|uniref:hypothetical protein n=1 Tax=Mesorhizobium sp. M0187 TaxID=2956908 RepID=UPI003339035D